MKYQIQGISYGGCIARVKNVLEAHEEIEKVNIFFTP
jgi:copper chaperone CopZ